MRFSCPTTGAGIDTEKVKEPAVKHGLLSAEPEA
jgi:hypothetical protein